MDLLIKERLQNADEIDEGDMSESEDVNNSNNGDINEPLAFVFEKGSYIFIKSYWPTITEQFAQK